MLNLKFKDFVFIDDRADQRSLVQEAIPEIHVLDATSSRTWKQLAVWAAALPDDPETDRTLQYRQRREREGFIAATAEAEEDQTALFAKLEIRVEIRPAKDSELGRVTELINRTNQFNLAGSRTSLKEIREWHASPGKRVVVVDASDKFGPMGLICATLLDLTGHEISIPVFVLSCRVFGYGIEHAVLSAIKRLAHGELGGKNRPIRGAYRETAHNEPCRRMYPENGFSREDGSWVIREVDPIGNTPPGSRSLTSWEATVTGRIHLPSACRQVSSQPSPGLLKISLSRRSAARNASRRLSH